MTLEQWKVLVETGNAVFRMYEKHLKEHSAFVLEPEYEEFDDSSGGAQNG